MAHISKLLQWFCEASSFSIGAEGGGLSFTGLLFFCLYKEQRCHSCEGTAERRGDISVLFDDDYAVELSIC